MNRLEEDEREHVENLAEKKAEIDNEHYDTVTEDENIAESQETRIT